MREMRGMKRRTYPPLITIRTMIHYYEQLVTQVIEQSVESSFSERVECESRERDDEEGVVS
jgi:hypothetical protein